MAENNEKSTLELLQEESNVEPNPYFDETTGLDLTPDEYTEEPDEEKVEDIFSDNSDDDFFFDDDDEEALNFINEDDEDDYELPRLDPELENNPVLLKRAQEYEKGVKKLINRVKQKEEELSTQDEQVNVLRQWNDVLTNPETVQPGLKALVTEVCKMYNLDPYDVFLDAVSSPDPVASEDNNINALVEAKVQERLKGYEEDLSYVRNKKEKEETEQALKQYIDTVATKTISIIKSNDNGWEITEEMIREAVTALPNLLKNPVKAVRSYYSDERLAHYQKANRSKGTAPNLATQSNVGYQLPDDPTKIKAIDIMRMLNN